MEYYHDMRSRLRCLFVLSVCVGLTSVLTGCGAGTVTHSVSGTFSVSGRVHGGQQPVTGAGIQLYAVGTGGDGSLAVPMLKRAVASEAGGLFDISGDYTCASDDEQMYIVASGGNPGLAAGTNNAALVMMAALGSCSNLSTAGEYIEINEVTTVAAAWALSPFIASAAYVGAGSGNGTGMANAMLDAQLLADSSTGLAATLPAGLSVEADKLYALADALASCVNSDGTTGCAKLFAAAKPAGGSAPTDTLQAALNIVRHPGENVAAVFGAIDAQAPFATAYTSAPSDWTMSLSITGNGLDAPASLGVDSVGNVWVANSLDAGSLSAFTPQGMPLGSSPFGVGTLSDAFGLAIDPSDNVWVTNLLIPHGPGRGSVTAFLGEKSATVGGLLNGTAYYSDSSVDYPQSVAADTNGDIFVASYVNSAVTEFNGEGGFLERGLGASASSFPVALAVDDTHGVWIANQGDNSVTHIDASGTVLLHLEDCCDGANSIALDSGGNAWVANYHDSSVEMVPSTLPGSGMAASYTGGGVYFPYGVAIDAKQNVWVANYYGSSVSEIEGIGGPLSVGTAISPAAGYGVDANMMLPYAIAPDASGNLWVTDYGVDSSTSKLVMFFGLAAPTRTPVVPVPVAP